MPTPLEDTLLAALKDSFNDTNSGLAAAVAGGIWDTATNRSPAYPLLMLSAVEDPEPGETFEDRRVNVTFRVEANTEADVLAAAAALRTWFDPNVTRPRLQWATGNEVTNWRGTDQLERPSQRVKGGARLWILEIPYVFHVFDTVQ